MNLLKTHPARVYALVVAVLGLLVAFGVRVPETSILGVVTAVLALVSGEVVQRTEDGKTADALATQPETHTDPVSE
ncbi:hypothetical protein ACFCZT_07810 [Streptomyces sp. NPDC056230]|uniref:hypothetical protein n=1 Tax=Streptomyces sp. NPDC056230 TaxID=3345754 RepID=UPI0035E0F09D